MNPPDDRYNPVDPSVFDEPWAEGWVATTTHARAELHAGSFTAAGVLAAAICALADEVDHHPDVEIHYPDLVAVTTSSHVTGGLTNADVDLAKRIAELAAR